ncbi:MAG TPA: hypothetical protein VFY93_15060 [Planctomycetota bacterium]|nr:hypothetical protein [Planctomycetota bacterium]
MRRIMLLALVAAACQSTPKELPESWVDTRTSAEYDQVRPVTIAVMPVKAPRADLRINLRQEVYKILPGRKYSPFKLDEVDAHVDSNGKFSAEDLDWDATLEVVIDKWYPVSGTNRWSGSGHAVMTHRTGEVLWTCDFRDYTFVANTHQGVTDYEEISHDVAYFLVGSEPGKTRLPDCPPPPKE